MGRHWQFPAFNIVISNIDIRLMQDPIRKGTKRGIRIHVGNDAVNDSSGCVLVGMGRNGDKLVESQPAETMVTMLCRNVKKLVITEN